MRRLSTAILERIREERRGATEINSFIFSIFNLEVLETEVLDRSF